MKWSISSAIVAMLMLVICVSCSNNIFDDDKSLVGGVSDVGVLRVEMESSDTRTYIDNECHIHWNNDDRVSVFYGNGDNVECRFEGKTGDRSGEIRPVKTYNSKPAILDAIYALYPYSKDVVLQEEDLLTLTLPTIQSYVEDSFGRGANTMVAVS
ncbi:MAG: hypothetical protein IIX34_03990, partial [Alistipes sp.]|nr:hypothetical protein [Alistipes sp.]